MIRDCEGHPIPLSRQIADTVEVIGKTCLFEMVITDGVINSTLILTLSVVLN
jgi:hypothetical protein